MWQRLSSRLAELGADSQALNEAAAEGPDGLRRMIARYFTFPGARRYTPRDVYAACGVDEETAQALWRAMGFPLVPEDEPAFTDADIEALRIATGLFDRAGMDQAIVLQQARSMGQAAARIAASHQDVIGELIPGGDPERAADQALSLAEQGLPALDRLLVYMYRRHLAVATEQRFLVLPAEEGGVRMSVGFADLTGFTALSQELEARELATLIDRFNGTTANVVAQGGGRVIKTIGDEVMFAAQAPGSAASIALTLIGAVSEVHELPALKVGLATGSVIAREGDLFGSPVNLANRLVTSAKAASVLVDEETRDALADDDRYDIRPLGKRYLKGFGFVRAFRLRAPKPDRARREPAKSSGAERRSHHRRARRAGG